MNILQWRKPTPHSGSATLICLHCSAGSGRQWTRLSRELDADVTVLTPDLLGYGERPAWPAATPVTLDDEVDALAPLLDAHPRGVHLLGHSYGGAVALQMALRWPERILSLTVFEPVRFKLLLDRPRTNPAACEVVRLARKVQATAQIAPETAALRFVDYWSGAGSWEQLAPARKAALAERMGKVGADFGAVLDDATTAAEYARLRMPVRLLGGDASPEPVRLVLARLAALLPHAERATLEGLGHMGPVQSPERVAAALPVALRGQAHERAEAARDPCQAHPSAAAAAARKARWTLQGRGTVPTAGRGLRGVHGRTGPWLASAVAAAAIASSLLLVESFEASGAVSPVLQPAVYAAADPYTATHDHAAGRAESRSRTDGSPPDTRQVLQMLRDTLPPLPAAMF